MDRDGPREASALNRELTQLLVDAGHRSGFNVHTEYAVPGGRLDVVWSWEPPMPIPGLHGAVPVVGFEIESSWRTRKHVKGDLLNLQDTGVALGVIVLAGADERDDSLRRFATALVQRPGAQILIWTEDDVRGLAAGHGGATALADAVAAAASAEAPSPVATEPPDVRPVGVGHEGKYEPLWAWLATQEHRELPLTFGDVERVLRFPLPDSCRGHLAHWHSYQGSAVARAIIDAGWHASGVDLSAETVVLAPGPPPGRR